MRAWRPLKKGNLVIFPFTSIPGFAKSTHARPWAGGHCEVDEMKWEREVLSYRQKNKNPADSDGE